MGIKKTKQKPKKEVKTGKKGGPAKHKARTNGDKKWKQR